MESGSDLSSRAVSSQVLSALKSLTAVFGMGTGGTSSSLPPEMVLLYITTTWYACQEEIFYFSRRVVPLYVPCARRGSSWPLQRPSPNGSDDRSPFPPGYSTCWLRSPCRCGSPSRSQFSCDAAPHGRPGSATHPPDRCRQYPDRRAAHQRPA